MRYKKNSEKKKIVFKSVYVSDKDFLGIYHTRQSTAKLRWQNMQETCSLVHFCPNIGEIKVNIERKRQHMVKGYVEIEKRSLQQRFNGVFTR